MNFEEFEEHAFMNPRSLSPLSLSHDEVATRSVTPLALGHALSSSPLLFRRTSSASSVSSYCSSGPTTPTEEVPQATITPGMLYLSQGSQSEYDLESCPGSPLSCASEFSTPIKSEYKNEFVKSEFFMTPYSESSLMTPSTTDSCFSPFYSPSPMSYHSSTAAASYALQKVASVNATPSPPTTPPPMVRSKSSPVSPTSLSKRAYPLIVSSMDKPHKCEQCAKRFKRLEHLRRHSRTHTDERPFICDVDSCKRKFSRSDNLRAHRRTHMRKGGRNGYVEGLSPI